MRSRKRYIVVALGGLAIAACFALGPHLYSEWQKRQLVERLKDVKEWNRWREVDQYQTRIDLSGVDLRGANLAIAGSDGRGADLRNTDLRRADLRGADLRHAIVFGADFTDADLCKANLEFVPFVLVNDFQSELVVRNWRTANFKGANIYGIKNPPESFIEFALKQGAIQEPPRSE